MILFVLACIWSDFFLKLHLIIAKHVAKNQSAKILILTSYFAESWNGEIRNFAIFYTGNIEEFFRICSKSGYDHGEHNAFINR